MEILEFAKAYRDLGEAVQEQLDKVLDGKPEDCNPEAIEMMYEAFNRFVGVTDIPDLDELAYTVSRAHLGDS